MIEITPTVPRRGPGGGPVSGRCLDLFPPWDWHFSFGNDFNRYLLEAARIATLSQQIALRGPNRIFLAIALPPPTMP
jgi:hypothetical protein